MVIYRCTKEKNEVKKGEMNMLNDEICKLRDKLNKSIENNEDYSVIYKLSVELDELIAKYYKDKKDLLKKMYEKNNCNI